MNKHTQEELAFIDGTEFALDYDLPIPDEDFEKYLELTSDRGDTNDAQILYRIKYKQRNTRVC